MLQGVRAGPAAAAAAAAGTAAPAAVHAEVDGGTVVDGAAGEVLRQGGRRAPASKWRGLLLRHGLALAAAAGGAGRRSAGACCCGMGWPWRRLLVARGDAALVPAAESCRVSAEALVATAGACYGKLPRERGGLGCDGWCLLRKAAA